MKALLFSLLAAAILIMPFISAVPPVTQVQQFSEGYLLQTPSDNSLELDENYTFEIHVFNISDGLPIVAGISCYFHLYNSSGEHIVELTDTTSSSEFDYSFQILSGNFSESGIYYYFTQCNSSILGGYASNYLEITPNGSSLESGDSILYCAILILLFGVSIFLTCFGYSVTEPVVKGFFSILGLAFLVGTVAMARLFIGYTSMLDNMSSVMNAFMISIGLIFFLVLALVLLSQLVSVLKSMSGKKGYASMDRDD